MQTFTYKEKKYPVVEHFHGERLIGSDNIGKFFDNFYVCPDGVDMDHKEKVMRDLKHLRVPYVVIYALICGKNYHILLKEPDNINKWWPHHAYKILGMIRQVEGGRDTATPEGEETRQSILDALAERPDSSMTQIIDAVGISRSPAERHIKILIANGKVVKSCDGQPYKYRLCS